MFGISNSIVNETNSGLNSLVKHNVFNNEYAEFFTMTKTEVDEAIERLFIIDNEKLKKEAHDKIKKMIDYWYNGYYHTNNEQLYSIFSVSLYLAE